MTDPSSTYVYILLLFDNLSIRTFSTFFSFLCRRRFSRRNLSVPFQLWCLKFKILYYPNMFALLACICWSTPWIYYKDRSMGILLRENFKKEHQKKEWHFLWKNTYLFINISTFSLSRRQKYLLPIFCDEFVWFIFFMERVSYGNNILSLWTTLNWHKFYENPIMKMKCLLFVRDASIFISTISMENRSKSIFLAFHCSVKCFSSSSSSCSYSFDLYV